MTIVFQYVILLVGNRQGVFFVSPICFLSVSYLFPISFPSVSHVVRMFIGTYMGVTSDLLGKCHGHIYIKVYVERCNMKLCCCVNKK